ncbi:hypothetical protein [Vibrio breoganii]|uniref:hypothetical protein n=1 Tax=Vibrio breoganii TaxID=553239 RepID=UPI0021C261DD|nr:hypothetical protein [Vibrio breoganii]MDN3716566.1 hypothetical protein [Vibrio breoganii]
MNKNIPLTFGPFVTYELYSQLSGIPVNTIKDYVNKGRIIIKKKALPREKPLINMVAMLELAAKESNEYLR